MQGTILSHTDQDSKFYLKKHKFLYCVEGYTNSVFLNLDPYQNQNLESALKFRYKVPQNRKSNTVNVGYNQQFYHFKITQ